MMFEFLKKDSSQKKIFQTQLYKKSSDEYAETLELAVFHRDPF